MTTPQRSWRDTLAEMLDFERIYRGSEYTIDWKCGDVVTHIDEHPIPNSLDTIAELWGCLDGWNWNKKFKYDNQLGRTIVVWLGSDGGRGFVYSPYTHDEITDRGTLLVKVLDWLKANDEPAFKVAVEKMREAIR